MGVHSLIGASIVSSVRQCVALARKRPHAITLASHTSLHCFHPSGGRFADAVTSLIAHSRENAGENTSAQSPVPPTTDSILVPGSISLCTRATRLVLRRLEGVQCCYVMQQSEWGTVALGS